MAQQIIGVGLVANDGLGDPLRTAWIKTNDMFTELYATVSPIGNNTELLFRDTGATYGYNTSSNLAWNSVSLIIKRSGFGTTSTESLVLINQTAATIGAPVQYSPRLTLKGQGWVTDLATSQYAETWLQTEPAQRAGSVHSIFSISTVSNGSPVKNLQIAEDPVYAGYTNIYPGGVIPNTSNYAWQIYSSGSEIWFNSTGYYNFCINNSPQMYVAANTIKISDQSGMPAFTGRFGVKGVTTGSEITLQTRNSAETPLVTMLNNGYSGFGTDAPTQKIVVSGGTIQIIDGNQADNYVFTSNASGVGRWQFFTASTSGTSGTSGISGTSGTSGVNGTSGTSGVNGTSGTSGSSGIGFTTITNPLDNRVLTSDGSVNSANAETNMTFNGNTLLVTGSGGTIVDIQGSFGQLFSVYDSLSGDILSVNDISGIPILAVNSNERVTIDGILVINSILYTNVTGNTTITTILKTSCVGVYLDYYVKDGSNMRMGTVMSVWDGTNIVYTDTSTSDIGDTSPITLYTDISGSDVRIWSTVSSGTWTIKLGMRLI